MSGGLLDDAVGVCFHYFLARERLTGHRLWLLAIIVDSWVVLAASCLSCWPHSVRHSAKHISWVIEIVGSKCESIQVVFLRTSWTSVRVGCSWIARIGLLLVLQIAFHKLSYSCSVASWIVLIGGGVIIVVAYSKHGRRLRLRMTLTNPFAILDAPNGSLKTHLL